MASKERFSSVTEEELQQIKIDNRAESTVKATKFWSSLFEDYLREKFFAIDLKTCTADELAAVLNKLYVEVRKKDGSFYQRTSVRGLRVGIHRYIREPPFSRTDLSLFRENSAFVEANDVLDARLRVLKKQGELKATDHIPPLLHRIWRKLGSSSARPSLSRWIPLTWHSPVGSFWRFTLVFVGVKCSWICASRILRFRPTARESTTSIWAPVLARKIIPEACLLCRTTSQRGVSRTKFRLRSWSAWFHWAIPKWTVCFSEQTFTEQSNMILISWPHHSGKTA